MGGKKYSIIFAMLIGGIAGMFLTAKSDRKKTGQIQKMSEKHLALFLMMNKWVRVKQDGKKLTAYFTEHGYHKIAIYGMSYAGETLWNELKYSDIEIAYGIERLSGRYSYIDVLSMEESLPEVDAVVVTAVTFFDQIEQDLKEKVTCPVISLEEILNEV
jgi:hypothetical protein